MEERPQTRTRAELARRRRQIIRRRRTVAVVGVSLVVVVVAGFLAIGPIKSLVSDVFGGGGDYEGRGSGQISIEVPPGSSGIQVANLLVENDVIKSADPFLSELEAADGEIQAGTFVMRKQMSGAAAVDLLLNPEEMTKLVIPEGFKLAQIRERMIASGFGEQEVDAALDRSPEDLDLPAGFPSLEGLAFPATYDIKPDMSAEAMVDAMAARTRQELDDLGIGDDEALEVLTLASLVQVESPGDNEVRAKVARVFLNRISDHSQTAGLLQSDATVHYIHGSRPDASTTAEERASDNPYNTYKHPGLPPGPINSPGRESVEAALNPADGDWQFFVAVNPDTGETRFADTYSEHQKNVEEYRKWLREHRADESGDS